jgi:EAL domain-containing protein (putative c-di-GMP-specific phosphodiesterase class I)
MLLDDSAFNAAPRTRDGESPAPLRRLLDAQAIITHFQPIFSVRGKNMVGVEALSRGVAAGGRIVPPSALFEMAAAEQLKDELEDTCRRTAIRTFSKLEGRPDELLLFLNLDFNGAAGHEALPAELARLVQASNLLPRNVAVEFLESRLEDVGRFGAIADELRRLGFLVVLDDVGAGHSNLDRIPLFRPDVIKIDRSLISGVQHDFYKQETLKSLVGLSRRIGSLVIAEGIECEAEAIAALELGADLLQGFFLSRPQPIASFGRGMTVDAGIEKLARNFKRHMVGEINDRKREHRNFNVIQNRMLCELTNAQASEFDAILAHLIGDFPKVECVYVLDDAGTQVTETISGGAIAQQRSAAIFRPAPKGTDHSLKEYYYVLIDVELQKYTTDPYVSLASGNLCRTISTCFRDAANNRLYVLCLDVNSWMATPGRPASAPFGGGLVPSGH